MVVDQIPTRIRWAVDLVDIKPDDKVLEIGCGPGAAAELMDASVECAAQRGAAAVWLGVNELNARANRFYGKHGFENVGIKHFELGGKREDDYVRERVLDRATRNDGGSEHKNVASSAIAAAQITTRALRPTPARNGIDAIICAGTSPASTSPIRRPASCISRASSRHTSSGHCSGL